MKPNRFFKASEPATITNMVAIGLSAGVDRFVGVQPAQEGMPNMVGVFLMSDKAIREIGPFLRDHVAKLPKPDGENLLTATIETTLPQIMRAAYKAGFPWMYMPIKTSQVDGLLTVIIGDSVNESFAAELTKRGAICNLT